MKEVAINGPREGTWIGKWNPAKNEPWSICLPYPGPTKPWV